MTSKQFSRFSDFFKSRKTVVTLILLVIVISLLGVLIPQENIISQEDFIKWQDLYPVVSKLAIFFGTTRVFTNPLFITTVGLLSVSLFVCTYNRAVVLLKSKRLAKDVTSQKIKQFKEYQKFTCKIPKNDLLTSIEKRTKIFYKGFHIKRSINGACFSIKAERGVWGKWGSLFFHFSFIVILFGALASVWTRFEGKFLLTEEQTFEGMPDEYSYKNTPVLFQPEKLGFQLKLKKFIPSRDSQKEYSRDRMQIIEKNGKIFTKDIRKYYALTHQGFTFYQKEHGFSPSVTLKSFEGETIFQSYIAFRTRRIGENFIFEDAFEIPGKDFKVYGRIYPDAFKKEGKLDIRSNNPNNPLLSLTVSSLEKEVYRGNISINQAIQFDNYTLSFNDLRYWSSFRVVRDYGIPFIYLGFFIGIMGLLIRLVLNQQEILIEIAGERENFSTVRVLGKTEREKTLFAEKMNTLIKELKTIEGIE